MNLKVMNRMAVGTLFATALCLSGCNHSKNKPVDTTPDTDTVEFVKDYTPEEASNVEEISFEPNRKFHERAGWREGDAPFQEYYNERGTYGTSMMLQRHLDFNEISQFANGVYEDYYKHKAERSIPGEGFIDHLGFFYPEDEDGRIDYRNNENYPEVQEYLDAQEKTLNIRFDYIYPYCKEYGEYLHKLDEDLYKNGPISRQKCMAFIDRQLSSLDCLSMDDYENLQKEIEDFKKAQGKETTQTQAELIAFKQFKLDSIAWKNFYKSQGLLEEYKLKQEFDKILEKIRPKP